MSKTFDELWREVCQRSASFPVVQEYHELRHVYELMQGCDSYLEVGTAEGNSLYVLAHALKPGAHITYIDIDEAHTRAPREEVVRMLKAEGFDVRGIHGDSNDPWVITEARMRSYDVALIDAGHSYFEVVADARHYAPLASKFVCFHDVQLLDVGAAFAWYLKESGLTAYRVVNSETFGYGIIKK